MAQISQQRLVKIDRPRFWALPTLDHTVEMCFSHPRPLTASALRPTDTTGTSVQAIAGRNCTLLIGIASISMPDWFLEIVLDRLEGSRTHAKIWFHQRHALIALAPRHTRPLAPAGSAYSDSSSRRGDVRRPFVRLLCFDPR